MKRHALFVGVDQYADGHIPNLSCAVSDATDLHGFFKYGAGYDQVELLQNPAGKKEVLGAVREMTAGLGGGDFFLFFFAGHGFRVGENHVLVCAKDLYEDVKYEDDGLPLGQLKRRLSGSFDSALFLDACQSDILATRGGEGIAERDLSLIHETQKDEIRGGALTIVTSCDAGQTAAELSEVRHGLFTMAMLDLLKEAQGTHVRIDLSDTFRRRLGRRMGEIAARSGLSTEQRPRFSCTGDSCFILLDGSASGSVTSSASLSGFPLSPHVVCPICGRHNDVKDTFRCPVCGKDHLCLSHQSKDAYCCPSCAEKQTRKGGKTAAFISKHVQMVDISDEGEYEGGVDSKGLPHGKGKFTYPEDGVTCVCEGEFSHGTRNGFFTMAYDDGARYEGTLWNGVRSGKGKWTTQSGGVYEGEFKEGQFSGFGVFRYTDGNRYEGDWFDGRKHGHGRIVHPDGKAEEGLWQDGKWAGLSIVPLIRRMEGSGIDESDKELKDGLSWYRNWFYREGNEFGDKEAVKCFKKSAERGNPDAQYCLGACYVNGQGVEKNFDLALKWFWKASANGQKMAKEALRKYEQSWVCEVDKKRAAQPCWRRLLSVVSGFWFVVVVSTISVMLLMEILYVKCFMD